MHQQPSIASIILLLARLVGADLCRVSHPALHAQLFHQLQEPLRRTTGFNPHPHRTRQPGVKLAYFIALVPENVLFHFSRFRVQHRQRLLSRMQIAAYNAHLGLLRSELLLRVEAATVYPHRLRGRLRYLIREYHSLSQLEIVSGIAINEMVRRLDQPARWDDLEN